VSIEEWEIFFNVVCFGIILVINGFVLFMYRQTQPKFYRLLFWAVFLTFCSALTYGLYTALLDGFLVMKSTDGHMLAAKSRLVENMRLLALIVPGFMLAIAANLITSFLHPPNKEPK